MTVRADRAMETLDDETYPSQRILIRKDAVTIVAVVLVVPLQQHVEVGIFLSEELLRACFAGEPLPPVIILIHVVDAVGLGLEPSIAGIAAPHRGIESWMRLSAMGIWREIILARIMAWSGGRGEKVTPRLRSRERCMARLLGGTIACSSLCESSDRLCCM